MKLFEDGDPFFAPMLNALFAAFRGTAVMNGCEVSATGTSRTVSITAGTVQINGEVIAVSAGSVTLDAGSTFDRYDLVSVNASGSKIVTKGTTKRKCPTQPANTCLLAIVFVPAGATVIATGNVYDARLLASRLAAAALTCTGPAAVGGSPAPGPIDTPAGNIGARSEFVDVAGLTTLRKSQIKTIGCSPGQTVTLMSVIVPSNYSSTIASNCTLRVKAMNPRTIANYGTITVYCNGVPIGSAPIGELYDNYLWMPPFNTTGGFKAGDTLEIKLSAGGTSGEGPSVAEIHIYSSRATNVAACKVFPEEGAW